MMKIGKTGSTDRGKFNKNGVIINPIYLKTDI